MLCKKVIVGSGQWAVGSGQWAVGSGQWAKYILLSMSVKEIVFTAN